MATDHIGSLGPRSDLPGLLAPLPGRATTLVSDSIRDSSATIARQETGPLGWHIFPPPQGSRRGRSQTRSQSWVLFPLLSGSEKDRRSATIPQPQRSQQVSAGRYLSHGNSDLQTTRYSSRLVDGLSRSQGCLPPCASTQVTLAAPAPVLVVYQ